MAEAIVNLPKADWHRYRQMAAKAISGAEWLLDWRNGKKTVQENGLHYLVSL